MTFTDRINSWIDYTNGWLHGFTDGRDWVVPTLVLALVLLIVAAAVRLLRRR